MEKFKWCVCDMDGTLLNSEGKISKENEAALKKLQQKGTDVIIASGRVDLMVKSFIKQLGLKGHVISCNGGLIRNIQTGDIVYSQAMDKSIVKEIINHCAANNIDFLVYTAEFVYSNENNPKAEKYEKLNKVLAKDFQYPMKYIYDKDIDSIEDILKVLLICKKHEQVESLQKKYSKFDSLTAVSSATGLLDIMAADTTKGKALKILAEKMKVNLDKVIAFGDNYNDLEMLGCVGMPIAMENAVEKLKEIAKHITKSNDESGIAYAINKFILQD